MHYGCLVSNSRKMWMGSSFVETHSHLACLIIGLNCLNPGLSYTMINMRNA